eukprot:TRINITY_DN3068_c11_g2_i1.p2 TRINITY_DN3068_c11_g2~~TRINITY_DN3068_c11_g2_i1.p2  ORF type:complete len:54 (+),score=14.46 TRINITY_DN3068_c11_g2_i1:514-675(+)
MREIGGVISYYVYNSEYSPNGKQLVCCDFKKVHVFDAETGMLIHTLEDHTKDI